MGDDSGQSTHVVLTRGRVGDDSFQHSHMVLTRGGVGYDSGQHTRGADTWWGGQRQRLVIRLH